MRQQPEEQVQEESVFKEQTELKIIATKILVETVYSIFNEFNSSIRVKIN